MDKVEITKAALANLRKHEDCAMSFHAKGTGGRGPAELHLYGPAALAVYRIYSMGNDAAAAIEALQAQVAAKDAEITKAIAILKQGRDGNPVYRGAHIISALAALGQGEG